MNPSISIPNELIGEASGGHSTVFFGNISYDCDEIELDRTLRTAGPFRDMKLMYGDDNKPKGFGFCTYNDPDLASSSIRNLNKLSINNRELKVHFASDKQSGTNLKPEEVQDRDSGEIVRSIVAGANMTNVPLGATELLNPTTSSLDDMFRSLSDF